MLDDVYDESRQNFGNSLKALEKELARVRTGRANLAILDGIRVEYYGSLSPLSQVATLMVADPRMITIRPWEKSLISVIEKAIMSAGLGLTPSNDGEIIRLGFPPLTGERRAELGKVVRRSGENNKVAIRNQRRQSIDFVRELEKEKEISEDDRARALKKIQGITDEFIKKVDEMVARKEEEIREI